MSWARHNYMPAQLHIPQVGRHEHVLTFLKSIVNTLAIVCKNPKIINETRI